MNQRSRSHTLLPLPLSPPLLLPCSWIAQRSPSLFMSWCQRSHVCRGCKGKRGECLWASHNSGVRACACVSVCEVDGAGEDRGHTLVDAETAGDTVVQLLPQPFTSEPSSVRLSWGFLFLWTGCVNVWMGCLKEMLAKEWLMRTSAPVWRVTPCVHTTTTTTTTTRGELDAWRFHSDYNGLQSVHFTEARGTLQAAVWDCTGERRNSRLWHWLCVFCAIHDA